jgi:hypothetical protein
MDQRELYARALSHAVVAMGGRPRLAAFLHVSEGKLDAWLAGDEIPPLEAFLDSLDVIADGPYARGERPIRVAAIRNR